MLMKLLITPLLMTWLSICVLACGPNIQIQKEMVYPPLPNQLILKSLIRDKNDKTNEVGWWIDDHDMKKTAKFTADIEIIRREAEKKKK